MKKRGAVFPFHMSEVVLYTNTLSPWGAAIFPTLVLHTSMHDTKTKKIVIISHQSQPSFAVSAKQPYICDSTSRSRCHPLRSPLARAMPTQISLSRWFVTPVAPSSRRGPVRVWGYAADGRLWRSSSILHASTPRCLKTRYNTTVILSGPLDRAAAAAAALPAALVALFADGFPSAWRSAAAAGIAPPVQAKAAVIAQPAVRAAEPALKKRRTTDIPSAAATSAVATKKKKKRSVAFSVSPNPAKPPLPPPSSAGKQASGRPVRHRGPPRGIYALDASVSPPASIPSPHDDTRATPIESQRNESSIPRKSAGAEIVAPRARKAESRREGSAARVPPIGQKKRQSATKKRRVRHVLAEQKDAAHIQLKNVVSPAGKDRRRSRARAASLSAAEKTAQLLERESASDAEQRDDGESASQTDVPSDGELPARASAVTNPTALVRPDPFSRKRPPQPLLEDDDESVDFPSTPMAKNPWTREQLEAYDRQRTLVQPGVPNYWARVASGVPGRSMGECSALWDSKWSTPGKVAAVMPPRQVEPIASGGGRSRGGGASTPEIAARMVDVKPAGRKTARYKTNLRRVAAAISRDCDDEALEPPLPAAGFHVPAERVSVEQELRKGTPDTAAKSKRAIAERISTSQTPEILARGRSFGLEEADNYLSLFNRRRGAANASGFVRKTTTPSEDDDGDGGSGSVQPSSQPVDDLFGPEALALAEADDGASSDEGIFF